MRDLTLGVLKTLLLGRRVPIVVGWSLTNRCNRRCGYCGYWSEKGEELDTKSILTTIRELSDLGTKAISFTGGEVLLREDIGEIISYAVNKGILVKVNTNGFLVRERIADLKNVWRVNLSLDGPEEENDKIRGEQAYSAALEAAALLRESRIKINFLSVINTENLFCFKHVFCLAEKFSAKVFLQPATRNILGGKEENPYTLGEGELKKVWEELFTDRRYWEVMSNTRMGISHFLNATEGSFMRCAGGYITCRIEPDGKMNYCSRCDKTSPGNVTSGVAGVFSSLAPVECAVCTCAARIELNLMLNNLGKYGVQYFMKNAREMLTPYRKPIGGICP